MDKNHPNWLMTDQVQFTDENNHNPYIKEPCATCMGLGELEDVTPGPALDDGEQWVNCPTCSGTGQGTRTIRLFDNESPEVAVAVDQEGWLVCPYCQWRFTIRDRNAWTGHRHKRCGQLIKPAEKKVD